MSDEIYKVKMGEFDGPFHLLLDLIEKKKMHISDISLRAVTDEYLARVREMPEINIREATNFIIVAAALILIKSKSLLPGIDLSEDEEKEISSLEDRLRLFALIKEKAEIVRALFGKSPIFFAEERKMDEAPIFVPDAAVTIENVLKIAKEILEAIPKAEVMKETTVRKVISLEEMIERVIERISSATKLNFRDMIDRGEIKDEKEGKLMVIVSFLAVLELVRRGSLDATQSDTGEISVMRQELNQELEQVIVE